MQLLRRFAQSKPPRRFWLATHLAANKLIQRNSGCDKLVSQEILLADGGFCAYAFGRPVAVGRRNLWLRKNLDSITSEVLTRSAISKLAKRDSLFVFLILLTWLVSTIERNYKRNLTTGSRWWWRGRTIPVCRGIEELLLSPSHGHGKSSTMETSQGSAINQSLQARVACFGIHLVDLSCRSF